MTKLSSTVSLPLCIPACSQWEFRFLHIPTSLRCCQCFNKGWSNHSWCNPMVLMTRKKELLPRHHWIIYSRGQIKLNPARNQSLCQQCQAWVKLQLALCLLLLMILQLYHLPPPLPPSGNNLLACLLNASLSMPAVVLYFEGTTCKIRNALFCCLLCVICVKSTIRLYSTLLYSWLC